MSRLSKDSDNRIITSVFKQLLLKSQINGLHQKTKKAGVLMKTVLFNLLS